MILQHVRSDPQVKWSKCQFSMQIPMFSIENDMAKKGEHFFPFDFSFVRNKPNAFLGFHWQKEQNFHILWHIVAAPIIQNIFLPLPVLLRFFNRAVRFSLSPSHSGIFQWLKTIWGYRWRTVWEAMTTRWCFSSDNIRLTA